MLVQKKILLCFGLVALAASSSAQVWPWLKREIYDRIQLSGYRNLGAHFHTIDGDREAFNTLNYGGQGNKRFTDQGNVEVVGEKVLGILNFRGTITDSRFRDPQQQRFSIDVNKGKWTVNLGDIWGSLLNTNPYASVTRSMRGGMVAYRSGGITLKALRSEAKGSARTVSLQGNNSVGPYYLQSNQIVADSEQVQVDGVDMVLGKDYAVNYEVGYITFLGRVISPSSTIVITYEAFGFNSNPGVIQGVGGNLQVGKKGKFGTLGLTVLEQKPRGGGGLSTRLEQFQGFGAPSTPYFLQFEPLRTRPIIVKVDGILQVEGVDFYFDTVNPVIFYFTRTIPSTSNVDVLYTPKPTQTVDGNRRVLGFDYRLPVGRYGSVAYSQARGELRNEVNPLSGVARGLSAGLTYRGHRIAASATDVPDSYVGVESRGFQRNERASRFSFERLEGKVTYGGAYSNSRIALRNVDSQGVITFRPSRTTRTQAHVERSSRDSLGWSLEHTRSTARTPSSDNRLDSTTASLSQNFKRLTVRGGYERDRGKGNVSSTGGTQVSSVDLDSLFAEANYTLRPGWSMSSRATLSSIRTASDSGHGRDVTLSTAYQPSEKLRLEASYIDSDSGRLATLGSFQLGDGLGYDGNGFTGGAGTAGYNAGAINQRSMRLRAQSQINDHIALDARYYKTRAFGSVTSNSDTTGFGLGLDFDLRNNTTLNLGLDQTRTKFLDSPYRSDALSLDAYLDGSPKGRWSYRFSLSALLSGGTSTFAQDSTYLDGTLTYRLAARHALSFSAVGGRTTGYLPQEEAQFGLSYQYQIWQNVGFVASYRWRRVTNMDPNLNSGAYRSRGLDFELTFNFGR